MLQSIIRRGLMAMLMGLALCSLKSYAASRIKLSTERPVGTTITLSVSAEGVVSAKGLAGQLQTDGKAHRYVIEAQDIVLSGEITSITLSNQQITKLDVRQAEQLQALYCANNKLTELDLAYTPTLQTLDCTFNQLERLELPEQSALRVLKLRGNYVKSLATDRCPQLQTLDYSDNYYPTSVNLSKCPKLQHLNVAQNKLRALDLSSNPDLRTLLCERNEITSLDVAHLAALERLSVANNSALGELRMGEHAKLISLDIFATQVSSLDLAKLPQLEELYCAYCRLSSLDLSHSKQLRVLSCGKNGFKGLDVTPCPLLEELNCNDLEIETIDLSRNPKLTSLKINHNMLSTLDLSAQKNLKTLLLSNNSLKTLDLSAQTALEALISNENRLTSMTLPLDAPLALVEIYDNQIKDAEMMKIVDRLTDRSGQVRGTFKVINTLSQSEGNVCTMALVNKALGKHWRVVDYANFANFGDGIDYRGSDAPEMGKGIAKITFDQADTSITLLVETLGELQSSGTTTPIASSKEPLSYTLDGTVLTIRGDLYRLSISGASIKEIELSDCSYLRELALHDLRPATLALADLPALVSLDLHDNHLTAIELRGTPLLNQLSCYGNKLTVEAGKRIISSLPQRLMAEDANILWLDSKRTGEDNAFEQSLLDAAHAKGWEMSDYLGGEKDAVGTPLGFPLSNPSVVSSETQALLQVEMAESLLYVTSAPHTPVVLYDMSGQLVHQTETDAEGLCQIPTVSLTEALYIIATPAEVLKCAIL